jgi:xylulose-5-phosphate/fructose-6-phosphate phosphoketolase
MAVLNDLDRFHLAGDAIDRLPQLGAGAAAVKKRIADLLNEHGTYIRQHGEDMPSIRNWRWPLATRPGEDAF